NKVTEKKGKVKVTKDSEPPQITGLEPLTIVIGAKTDYNSGVSISDNRDPEPKLTVDSSNVNIQKEGTYT
ncbi:polysaccharide deacetylase, partial [Blautia wexlerae]|nr:polysaccharide deacetylase [Blautia wexlerae]